MSNFLVILSASCFFAYGAHNTVEIAQIYQINAPPESAPPPVKQLPEEQPHPKLAPAPAPKPAPAPEIVQSPDQLISVVAQQLQAFHNENYAGAYNDIVSKEFQKEMPLEAFKTFVQYYPILTKYKKASFDKSSIIIKGDKGSLRVILDPDAAAIPVQYDLIKEGKEWKIWHMHVVLPTEEKYEDVSLLQHVVEGQLKDMQAGKLDAAYNYTSKVFRENTSLDAFKEFAQHFPILTSFTSVKYSDPKIEKGIGTIVVELKNQGSAIQLVYTLAVEGNEWKIWVIKVLKFTNVMMTENNPLEGVKVSAPPKVNKMPDQQQKGEEESEQQKLIDQLNAVIKEQQQAIQQDDITTAYVKYTSDEFKSSTSPDAFKDFIARFPAFSKGMGTPFEKLTLDNNVPTLSGTLMTENGDMFHVEYDFIHEKDAWKILHIEISPEENAAAIRKGISESKGNGPMEFSKILIGNTVDKQGLVQDPKNVLKSTGGNIFVNLFIQNGKKGTRIELTLKNLDTGSNTPGVSTSLEDDGSAMISYDFTPPEKGWPVGSYRLLATSSTGENKTGVNQEFNFRIE